MIWNSRKSKNTPNILTMKTKLFLLLTVCFCSFSVSVKATGQAGELIIIGRDTLQMLSSPLERDSILARKVQERRTNKGFSTGLWRGYIGLWRLEEGKLYLEKLLEADWEKRQSSWQTINTDGIFDAYQENGRTLAGWYSGDIRVVKGEQVSYQHIGFARHYEYETIYTLHQGVVTSQKEIRNSLRKSVNNEYYYTMNMLFNGKGMKWKDDSLLGIEILPHPDGTVDRVKVKRYLRSGQKYQAQRQAKWKHLQETKHSEKALNRYWERTRTKEKKCGPHHPFTREAKACADVMGEWEVLTLDGKIQPKNLMIKWGKDHSVLKHQEILRLQEYPDMLEMDGISYRMYALPLQQDTEVLARLRTHLKGAFTTKNPRGYIARWKIDGDRLLLTGIRNSRTNEEIALSVLAPGNGNSPIEASWYTGHLKIATGGAICGWNTAERHEIACDIEKGRIVRRTKYDNYITPGDEQAYKRFVHELRSHDWKSYPELNGCSLHGNFIVYPHIDGHADSIVNIRLFVNGEKDGERYHREVADPADPWIVLVSRAAEAVERWEVRFIKGKVEPVTIHFDIKEREEEQKKKTETDNKYIDIDLREIGGGKVLEE